VGTPDEARETFDSYLAEGQEGIILKDLNGVWEDKRAKHQIKFKGELECELRVVGIQPGTGKYSGMLGALICESEDGVVKADVGSGFKDDQRVDADFYLDKIVSVKYNARIKNKQGEESLFLPVFIEVRGDKDIADRADQIK
jgi:ATP-dependent DNA ligase